MRVLVAGASGFVGRRLCVALEAAGHQVRAMTRHPESYVGAGEAVYGDVHDGRSLAAATGGATVAYYLVHSLDAADFRNRDARAARAFGYAVAKAGGQRIIYLGGLGDEHDDLSAHLRSRREVEALLGESGVPVTTLRAGIVVGHGGISWELTRQLVEQLPAIIAPRWAHTRTQPIAVADAVSYLVDILAVPEASGRALDIGGPDVLTYVDMLRRAAAVAGRPLVVLTVPLPAVSGRWLPLIADVDAHTAQALVESMRNEVVVREDSIRRMLPFAPMGYDDAVRHALAERKQALT